jgi:DNA-binding transcriptional regulator WhiA
MPIRHGVIRKYFDKFKYQKKKREMLFKLLEESESQAKEILKEDYVHYLDAIPEINQFLVEIEAKEKLLPVLTPE